MVKLPLLPVPAEDPSSGYGLRLMTAIWGYPFLDGTVPAPTTAIPGLFRWDPPRSIADTKAGQIGANSLMWHRPDKLRMTEDGPDGSDFAGSDPRPGPTIEDLWDL